MKPRDQLKLIRKEIKTAKMDGDQNLMLAKLKEFQTFHINHDFTFGVAEIYKYVTTLEKMGFEVKATEERKIVDDAYFLFWDKFKQARCEQIESINNSRFDYAIKFRCDNPEAPDNCIKSNSCVEPYNGSLLYMRYKACKNRPRCFCSVTPLRLKSNNE